MCLYPKLIRNPKYKANKKNGGNIPSVDDKRVEMVPIGCQECIECRKQKAREWQVRMQEDIKNNRNGKFITLTFNTESLIELTEEITKTKKIDGYDLDNEIAKHGVKLFLGRWRKKYSRSVRHWLTTELGHANTEHIHLHGILWTDESYKTIQEIWQYGYIWPKPNSKEKTWVNEKTVNYIIKYITKPDMVHRYYKSIILCSPGIGGDYIKRTDAIRNSYDENGTNETYRTALGTKVALPIYYRNKLYTEEEREKLWLEKLDKNERWVLGQKISIKNGDQEYIRALEYAQKINKRLGYRGNERNWEQEQYERERRILKQKERIQKKEE